jgi:hypothetical protein
MIQYQLGKLVQWSGGTLRTRKRIQKVMFLLKVAGCPIEAEYRLHHFGPYSSDVAQTTDVLAQMGLLKQECVENLAGRQFNYQLTPGSEQSLTDFEFTPHGQSAAKDIAPFRELAIGLINEDVRLLEVASTIAYFHEQGRDWSLSEQETCSFKSLHPEDALMKRAGELARRVFRK